MFLTKIKFSNIFITLSQLYKLLPKISIHVHGAMTTLFHIGTFNKVEHILVIGSNMISVLILSIYSTI